MSSKFQRNLCKKFLSFQQSYKNNFIDIKTPSQMKERLSFKGIQWFLTRHLL